MKKTKTVSTDQKGVSLLTLIAFTIFTFSCQSIGPKRVETTTFKPGKVVQVYELQKKTGERIIFSKHEPAVIVGDNIKGQVFDETGNRKTIIIPLSEVEVVWVKKLNLGKTLLGTEGILVGGSLLLVLAVVLALTDSSSGSTDYH